MHQPEGFHPAKSLFHLLSFSLVDSIACRTRCPAIDRTSRFLRSNVRDHTESAKYSVAVHSYVLMTNHVHLLMTPETEQGVIQVIQVMQALGRYYVRYIKQTYERIETLWEGRYKSTLVDSDNYCLAVSRYIELNPVREGMVAYPAEYPCSSYQYNALGKPIELIAPHILYQGSAKKDKPRQKRYIALFGQIIPDYTLEEVRHSINRGWVLGDEPFKQQIEK